MNPSEQNDLSCLITLIKTLQATIENLNMRLESFERENEKANSVIAALNLRVAEYESGVISSNSSSSTSCINKNIAIANGSSTNSNSNSSSSSNSNTKEMLKNQSETFMVNFKSDKVLSFENSNEQGTSYRAVLTTCGLLEPG